MNKNRDKLLEGVSTLAIVCNQWGDTGKGKFVDFFAEWADIIARGTGGANAGHTIRFGEKEYVFHLIPSGILYDKDGKINIIGSGTAFDPHVVTEELGILDKEGVSHDHLLFSKDAHLVLPQHLVMDRAKESEAVGKIGTTGRGIGPVYEDHYARLGLKVNDLLNPESLEKKIRKNIAPKIKILKLVDPLIIKEILQHEHIGNGRFYDEANIFNVEEIIKCYIEYGKKLGKMIRDTDTFLKASVGKKKILLEGAQGNLLSIDIGTYPYVTSSDCSINGLIKGVGLHEKDVDLTLGIVKAFYMTRVGGGPFPTELGGLQSTEWCATKGISRKFEKENFADVSINDKDEYFQGIAVRKAGDEYGATTGRPRRVGWLDLPLLRYSSQWSGPNVIFTKIDILDTCREIKICTAYEYTGPDFRTGEKILKKGDTIKTAYPSSEILEYCKPIYKTFEGWLEPIKNIREEKDLPVNLKTIITFIEEETGVKAKIISVGPDRDETIII